MTALLPDSPLGPVVPALVLVSAGSAVASLAVRWRRADSVERRQLLWLAFAVLVLAALHGLVGAYLLAGGSLSSLGGSLLAAVAITLLPIGATVAVVRHGLLDIELVVRRSVALVLLVSAVTVAYLGVFVVLGALGSTRPAASLLATVAAACVAVPVHARARAAVDRRLFGHRDPYRVLAELGAELQRGRGARPALDAMLAATRLAVRSPGAAVVTESGRQLGEDGQPPDLDAASLPLLHHGAAVGTLLVAPRSAGEPFSERDRGMLSDLAPHLAAAAAVVRLTDDVQHAREQLVLAREEERRRLRRDLHDGLGPTLAAISMRVALEREEAGDAGAARLAQVQDLVDAAVVEVRRLVDGLRPPALDDLGVVAAARERASELGLEVEWRIGDLPEMTAAAESAVYRISGEALTNVARHAGIRHCRVELRCHGAGVLLVVRDRGRGLSDAPPGTGRSSMRERAEELGGWCRVHEADGGGTEVVTWLPT